MTRGSKKKRRELFSSLFEGQIKEFSYLGIVHRERGQKEKVEESLAERRVVERKNGAHR
jgi:hypothetical protein